MLPEVRVQLERIRAAAEEAIEHAAQTPTREAWLSNRTVRRAVERCLINLGEEANSLRKSKTNLVNERLLDEVAGFRNRLVHDYLRIDDVTVFEIVSEDCPLIVVTIQKILDTNP
jgi:uncharacterized protein with HEPN domain